MNDEAMRAISVIQAKFTIEFISLAMNRMSFKRLVRGLSANGPEFDPGISHPYFDLLSLKKRDYSHFDVFQ